MPTYQYRCQKCGELFEHVEHIPEHAGQPTGAAPSAAAKPFQHVPTQFFAKTSRKS